MIDPYNGKLAMSMILTAVMESRELESTKEWEVAAKSITRFLALITLAFVLGVLIIGEIFFFLTLKNSNRQKSRMQSIIFI